MEVTQDQLKRLKTDWDAIAGEWVKVEQIGGAYYAFGSELACLRLFYKYRLTPNGKAKADYSGERGSWFFRLEV